MKFHRLLLPSALLVISACSQAEPPVNTAQAVNVMNGSVSAKEEDIIRSSLKMAIPEAEITAIKESP